MSVEIKTMDIKKPQQTTEQTVSLKGVKKFAEDIKGEIHRITWTSRSELIFYTKVVVLSTLIFGLSIYALDLTIQSVLNTLSYIVHLISA